MHLINGHGWLHRRLLPHAHEKATSHQAAADAIQKGFIAELEQALRDIAPEDLERAEADTDTMDGTPEDRDAAQRELDMPDGQSRLIEHELQRLQRNGEHRVAREATGQQDGMTNEQPAAAETLAAVPAQTQTLSLAAAPRPRYNVYQMSASKVDTQNRNAVISHYPGCTATPAVQCHLVYDNVVDGYILDVQGRPKGPHFEVHRIVPDEVEYLGVTINKRFHVITMSEVMIQVELYSDEDVRSLGAFVLERLGRRIREPAVDGVH